MKEYRSKRKEFRKLAKNYKGMFDGHIDTFQEGKAFNTLPYYENNNTSNIERKETFIIKILKKLNKVIRCATPWVSEHKQQS